MVVKINFPSRLSWFLRGALCFGLLLVLGWTQPALAIETPPLLTLDQFKARLRQPINGDGGTQIIDLRRFTLDLSPGSDLGAAFYAKLQETLQASKQPLGIDLSDSTILGDLNGSQLGLTPSPLIETQLTPTEQTRLQRDRRRLLQLQTLSQSLLLRPIGGSSNSTIHLLRGPLLLNRTTIQGRATFSNTFFLDRLSAQGSLFQGPSDWSQARFGGITNFAAAVFQQEARFRNGLFFDRALFNQGQFQGIANFQGSEFQAAASFSQSQFTQSNFSRTSWEGIADFAQTRWASPALLSKSKFAQALFFTDAVFSQGLNLRESQFLRSVNLRGATLLDRIDFGYCGFGQEAYLNVPGVQFDADRAKFIGDSGRIGKVIRLPNLQGNENLLRELVRNFRRLEQLSDANQVDYTRQRLRVEDIRRRTWGVNLNSAPLALLQQVGFSPLQAEAIIRRRATQPLNSLTELLKIDEVDLTTYTKLRDRIVAGDPAPLLQDKFNRLGLLVSWLTMNLLLLLSRNGTSFWLAFGVGLVAVANFAVMFWWIDRARRFQPTTILPSWEEFLGVGSLASGIALAGLTAIVRNGDRPALTLLCLMLVILPIPLGLIALLYRRGRFHPMLDSSYFVEEGTLRQLRILVGRLPIIPRYPTFQERYMPLPWGAGWNWLNYFDFSFNNFLRFGFNDIRLRDQHVPTLLNILVWYQWSLGTLYIALLLWTLSRTIPGLNLLIYFR
ncbi:MAG: pentapeptide repeat-containing protein [Alkalinema sp. RU_4_3]|nr:pentapeptide repeat-containing protein [Alkalinema sp. RU_4_3]